MGSRLRKWESSCRPPACMWQVGSVHVLALMEVESYAVHSLVSTVRGQRLPHASTVDCLRAIFPGGSMTGAPKLRSMQILDRCALACSAAIFISGLHLPAFQPVGHCVSRLEDGPRGIYSGSIGFIGFNSAFDLNIVIRTAVIDGDCISIGAGGAIVVQSDPVGEYEEMRLKAQALMRAVGECDGSKKPAQVSDDVV